MRRGILACLLIVSALCASGFASSTSAVTPPDATGTATHAAAGGAKHESTLPRSKPAVGVQFHGLWSTYTDAERARALTEIADMGAGWVRIDIGWAMLQPTPGAIDPDSWGVRMIDKSIRLAHERGLKVLGSFWLTPDWADPSAGERSAPADPADYGAALAWAAKHWKGEVQAWEVWNEPNAPDFFAGADPGTYTKLLCAAYDAVNADPVTAPIRVVFGGTSQNDTTWIEETYAAGAGKCFDIMATHPYQNPSDTGPLYGDGHSSWQFAHLRAVRKVMLANDDRRPVWVTEFGWSSHPNTGTEPAWELGVTEQQQARFTVAALRVLQDRFRFVHKAFVYTDRSLPEDGPHQAGFGILTYNLHPKPVYWAMHRWLHS